MVTFLTNKMTGEKRSAVTASCSLGLPMVPVRENAVPVQKDPDNVVMTGHSFCS